MGKVTGIAWTDHTFNPWHGCTKVSPGCDLCYAENVNARQGFDNWGTGKTRRTMSDAYWREPLRWNAAAKAAGVVRNCFVLSMGDYNDPEAPADQRERFHELVDQCDSLFFQILTKRPHLFERHLPKRGFKHDNVILGATAENQPYYDERIEPLWDAANELHRRNYNMRHPGGIPTPRVPTFISYEPALGPITLRGRLEPTWLIFGGETGPADRRRPMEQTWAENIKAECEEFNVKFFMKQMSAFSTGQAAKLIPAHLLLRQFPEVPGQSI